MRRIGASSGWRAWWVAAVLLVLALPACGVEQGAAARTVPGVRVPVPDGWRQITVCSGAGPATAALPSRVELDGPRDLRNIRPPAQGTFAWGYSPDRSIRYDLLAIAEVGHLADTDEGVARTTLLHLNGAEELVEFRNLEPRGDHVIGTYDESFTGRMFRMRFVADAGSVVVVGVGIYPNSPKQTIARAKRDLDVMWQTLEVAGIDGVATGSCDRPSDEPR